MLYTVIYLGLCVIYAAFNMSASLLRDLVDVDQLSVSSYLSCSWSFMVNIIHHFRKKSMDQCGRLSSNSRIWGLD